MTRRPIKIIQWNARGFYREKLEEFKFNLRKLNPHLVLLSETFWRDQYTIKFSDYTPFFVNRQSLGGGVAILVKKSITASRISLPLLNSIEVVCISMKLHNNDTIDVFSVYCPNGNSCSPDDLQSLFNLSSNSCIIGGDFNAHSSTWEDGHQDNQCGRIISQLLLEDSPLILTTPRNLGTRPNPHASTNSTIDLTFMSPELAILSSTVLGPYWSSDHLPVFIDLNINIPSSTPSSSRWKFKNNLWQDWNSEIHKLLLSSNFLDIQDPATAYSTFSTVVMKVSTNLFSPKSTSPTKEAARP